MITGNEQQDANFGVENGAAVITTAGVFNELQQVKEQQSTDASASSTVQATTVPSVTPQKTIKTPVVSSPAPVVSSEAAVTKTTAALTPQTSTTQADAPLTLTSTEPETDMTEQESESTSPAAATFTATREADVPTGKYTVVINYVFADGDQAASPWTATVAEGSSFSQTISSPTVVGYTPDKADVAINIAEGEYFDGETVTKTVTYNAALVKYEVHHYLQNLNDDNYTETAPVVDEKEGYTESQVGTGLENSYTGFYPLLYDTTTEIAADGSTVIEIYYDRYYYLMSFDLDGGYGVEPVYAKYGTPITAPGTPIKAGYVFDGWKDDETGTVYKDSFPYSTMPAKNTGFTAQWIAGNTTYDVVFWYENADDNKYSQAGVLNDVTGVAGSTVNGSAYKDNNFTGKDAEHFTYSHADSNVTVKGDGSTVVNVYFSRNVYTLTFVMGNHANSCTETLHASHSDSCYQLTCTLELHNHSSSGCTKATEASCGLTPHTHSSDCCTKEEHDHEANNCSWIPFVGWTCGKTEHTHGDGNCTYNHSEHTHTDDCYAYSCGKQAHTHTGVTGSCYSLNCGKHLHYHSGNTCYLVVTAKYDADITNAWNNNPVKAVIEGGSVLQSNITGDYYSFLEKMPGYDMTLTKKTLGSTSKTIYYYVEVLEGVTYPEGTTRTATKNGVTKTYYLYKEVPLEVSSNYYLTYTEDYFPITGFTQRDNENNWTSSFDSNNKAYLYYTRNSYDLTFSNNGDIVAGKGGSFLYQADISGQNFTPAYPSTLEPNAYVFEGWYTSPFFGDTKFNFTTTVDGETVNATMPANDLTLYARWVPINHNVKLFPTQADMDAATNQIGTTEVVAHGGTATEPADPTRGEYIFVGWFYMDGTTEKAFDFSMPVNQDLNLYAKWSSNTLMNYTIHYKLADGTKIAEDTTGSGLAGTTKTFEAKAGEELYDGYQSGYFPTTNSHSLTIDIENAANNVYTFIYVPKEKLPYTVMYLEFDGDYVYDGTETVLHDAKTAETRDAVITENFEPVTGYMPDAYQKRLVLSATESENVIIFWYVADAVHAPVQIIHYIQNAEGEDYTIYQESTDLNGVIGNDYSTNVLNITGYDFDHATANGSAVTEASGVVTSKVTNAGLILELYYNRELHPYEFKFLEQGTNDVLADSVTGTARYGAQVSQNAKTIDGYTCKDSALAITIQAEDGDTAVKNVRIFYYVEDTVTINYVAVGSGTVDRASEELKVFSGEAAGSTATANTAGGYKFVGWYDNAACSGNPISTDAHFTPYKVNGKNVAATYYAKFEEDEVTINYVAVGGGGNVNPASETVNTITGTVAGSTATVTDIDNYRFIGWFTDESCTQPVDASLVDANNKFVPAKVDGKNVAATYYAKFEPLMHITIHKEVDTAYDDNSTFVFKITGQNNGIVVDVTVKAGESVIIKSLPQDTYTVTEVNSGWRYNKAAAQSTNETKTLTFENTTKNNKWLGWTETVSNFFENFK